MDPVNGLFGSGFPQDLAKERSVGRMGGERMGCLSPPVLCCLEDRSDGVQATAPLLWLQLFILPQR